MKVSKGKRNFLDKYSLPKLNQDQISKLNRPKTAKKIETVIKSLPTKKQAQDQTVSGQNSTRLTKKNQYSSDYSTQ